MENTKHDLIKQGILAYFRKGDIISTRLIGRDGTILSGMYKNRAKLLADIEELDIDEVSAIYYCLNPVKPESYDAFPHKEYMARGLGARAVDIECYRRLFIDIDSIKRSGLVATAEEREASSKVRDQVYEYLESKGIRCSVASSGNGWYVVGTMPDMPVTAKTQELVQRIQFALKSKFSCNCAKNAVCQCTAKIDILHNADRLTRALGSINRKGEATATPYWQAHLIHVPDPWTPATIEALQALANEAPEVEKPSIHASAVTGDGSKIEPYMIEQALDAYVEAGKISGYSRATDNVWVLESCPWEEDHSAPPAGRDTIQVNLVNGIPGFNDLRASCQCFVDPESGKLRKRTWVDFRNACDPDRTLYKFPIKQESDEPLDTSALPFDDVDAEDRKAAPELSENKTAQPKSWNRCADLLDQIREGTELTEKGKVVPRPKHLVDEEVLQFVLNQVVAPKCSLYWDAYPYLFVPTENRIYNWDTTTDAYEFLSKLRLRLTQSHSRLVHENLKLHIAINGEHTRIEKYGCMRNDIVYVNNGRGGMFRITADDLTEVANGTDGVLMLAPKMKPWPTIAGNEDKIRELAKVIDHKGGKVADSPLCRHLTGMFEDNMTVEQYQQLLLMRYLSLFMGNSIALRPILMSLGEQGSGKSTLFEKFMWLLEGIEYESGALPTKLRDFVSSITNSQMQVFDNVDGTNFTNQKSDAAGYIDLMCKCSTGGTIEIAKLYETNVSKEYSLRCDLFLTARTNPFPSHRSDLARRMIFFPVRKPEAHEYVTVEKMKRDLVADSEDMKLETLVRLHYLVKALSANKAKEYRPISEMHSYESWTLKIADYEGWSDEMVKIWQRCMTAYQERVTEDSPLVNFIRRWIGRDHANIGRWVRAGEMYKELSERYARTFTDNWRSEAVFGKRLKENFSALRILGISEKNKDGNRMYCFTPDASQVGQCLAAYTDSSPKWQILADADDKKYENADGKWY